MREIGIIFRKEIVRAILNHKKSATRLMADRWGKVKKGDILWVKEDYFDEMHCVDIDGNAQTNRIVYAADGKKDDWKMFSSIFMPRWVSRITLEVTKDAYKQTLSEIRDEDAEKEGVIAHINSWQDGERSVLHEYMKRYPSPKGYVAAYFMLWDIINPQCPSISNPAPWVIEFERIY
jgi:hypothetical protein